MPEAVHHFFGQFPMGFFLPHQNQKQSSLSEPLLENLNPIFVLCAHKNYYLVFKWTSFVQQSEQICTSNLNSVKSALFSSVSFFFSLTL